MSIQAINNTAVMLQSSAPKQVAPQTEKPAPAKAETKGALDTFSNTLTGAVTGAQATGLLAATGVGIMTFAGLKDAPAFHRVLLSALNAGGGAMAGMAIGGLSGAVAGAVADSKSGGAMAGAATGAVAGAVALTALSVKSGKALDLKTLAGGAALGAALGAVGGFTGAAIKNK
ncbi:hypothetical protein COW36_02740 [bacterium (Candidatus Blackallbacteria) CG17_big_fil_post_rev_8_21_14_2_50_48_46]|uniref:Uncharacterized protein n=1 Tax=bacterium (Candidatus Blackallbacteria) CG17_big_fil_post_rev_8_21_14_2_50_48_46 TaxID=2014261 RepID=A0A2M7GA77_9BACT|nr:MAG: hypothetical protein COW64_12735 [bacterium (Candidatus Blackallbacteria) CG18_big_fil_WC_8_21_14_2_50_49_26]PIW19046.1 MAG: hypothetical protein COW36_02740 [bacterium (Candidatus Blackallbacteria) CG17_big_fil_post_rev_8_21_14_2_50_48_46]PIW44587.1 MAG: hypothetical protein COW20_23380 [bacterium (Candidatus Blackallbacteria) CG13_big_fil_rev_8_21_14_2_50_49_14]